MPSITFTNNYLIVRVDGSVKEIDLGSALANSLANYSASPNLLNGESGQVVVHYTNNTPARTFESSENIKLPKDINVIITGGGPQNNTVNLIGLDNKVLATLST